MNNEPVAWINEEEIGIMYAIKLQGAKDWKTNLGLVPEENDIPLYTHPAKTLTDNITEIKRTSDQSITIAFTSCRSASEFEAILKKASKK